MEQNNSKTISARSLIAIGIGICAILLLTLATSFLIATAVYLLPVHDSCLGICAMGTEAIAALAGGFTAARYAGSRGLIIGGICALAVWCILLTGNSDNMLISLFCMMIPGMAGGFAGSGRQ